MAQQQSFTVNNFNGGISALSNRGVKGSFKFGKGIGMRNTSSALTCNQALKKDSGSVVTDLIRFGVPATNGDWYGFGDTGKIYKRTAAGVWTVEATDADGEILGAAEYIHNDGSDNYVSHIVWATRTKLKKVVTTAGFGSPTTVATFTNGYVGEYHTMYEALGVLFICDADRLALLDYEGAVNTDALQFPGGIYSKGIIDKGNLVIIGASEKARQRKGFLFTWDKIQPSWLTKLDLQADGLNSLNFLESGILIQTGEEMKYWDTANFIPLAQLPGGGETLPGAQALYDSIPMFGVQGGTKNGVYGYGRRDKNSPYALNLEYVPSHGNTDNINNKIGCVSNHQGTLVVSWFDGTDYGVDVIDEENKAVATYESLEFDAGLPYAAKKIHMAKVVTRPLPAGTSIGYRYKTNNSADWVEGKTQSNVSTRTITGAVKTIFNVSTEGEIYEFELVLTPNGNEAPEVISVNNYYSVVGIH